VPIKISKILHQAADKYLWNGIGGRCPSGKAEYSCEAVMFRLYELGYEDWYELRLRIFDGMQRMGLNTHSLSAFDEFENQDNFVRATPASQGARYAWLKFAALIAEEQGV
jgi:hypothetical protein